MKRKLLTSLGAGLLLCAAGVITAQGQNTYVTFSVDMSSNLVAGTFNPPVAANVGGIPYGGNGTDTVYARGIFDGWASPGLQLFQVGSSAVYTNTANDTADQSDGNVNFQYDAYLNGNLTDEGTSDYANRMAYLPKGNNASLVLPTAFFNDGGPATTNLITFQVDMTEQIQLGAFHPGSGDYVVVAGSYQNFVPGASTALVLTNNPNILITNNNFNPPLIEANVWQGTAAVSTDSSRPVATVNCGQEFKYVIMPEYNWDSPQYPNSDPDSGNRFYTMSGNQTLPLVSFDDLVPSYLATVNISVDMSVIPTADTNFEPNSVTAWGTFNGWSGPLQMTNNPLAGNTNLYKGTIQMSEGVPYIVQFRYTNSYTGGWVYDYGEDGGPNPGNNNSFRHNLYVPITSTPVTTNYYFFFDDISTNDVLTVPTAVQFSVDMAQAVGNEGYPFTVGTDGVYLNGMFGVPQSTPSGGYLQNWYAWGTVQSPVMAPAGFQMTRVGSTTVYTNIIILPVGTPVGLSYQYGIDPDNFYGGPLEDETAPSTNHFRVVRTQNVGANPYVFATDTFTNTPYVEPIFGAGNIGGYGSPAGGNLTVGQPVAGKVPVSWLGRPGAQLQTANTITGPWTSNPATDGTRWKAGFSSTNGFVSVTNCPANGNTFFRLVKP
jgi:hypothetical protein